MAFTGYYPYTYDHTKVSTADQTNFTVLVNLTDNRLKQTGGGGEVTNVNGYDIGFYSDSGLTTKLKWDMEFYDGTAGQAIAWVLIASLSHSSDGTIYIAIGDSGITTFQGDTAGSYDSNTKGVFHLTAGLSVADATGLNTATNNGATAVAGQIDGGAAFSGSNQYIDGGNASSLPNNGITVSCIVKPGVTTRGDLVTRWAAAASAAQFDLLYGLTSGKAQFYVSNGGTTSNSGAGSTAMSVGTWYWVAGVFTGNAEVLYINGVEDAIHSHTLETLNTSTLANYRFGDNSAGDGDLTGSLDEIRFASTVRSVSWLLTEYTNQSNPGAFWTLGSWVGGGGGSATWGPLLGGQNNRLVQS